MAFFFCCCWKLFNRQSCSYSKTVVSRNEESFGRRWKSRWKFSMTTEECSHSKDIKTEKFNTQKPWLKPKLPQQERMNHASMHLNGQIFPQKPLSCHLNKLSPTSNSIKGTLKEENNWQMCKRFTLHCIHHHQSFAFGFFCQFYYNLSFSNSFSVSSI